MSTFRYTKDWFLVSEIRRYLYRFIDTTQPIQALEIGCYEGLSSAFFAGLLLNHNDSTLTCVDPFLTIEDNDHKQYLTNNEEKNFDFNISICKNSEKITALKITSDKFFESNTKIFNFIYVDGCHECDFITRDMENSFRCLASNGIMWMDDYMGGDGIKTKNTMEKFLEKYAGQYTLIHKGYQLAIRKH